MSRLSNAETDQLANVTDEQSTFTYIVRFLRGQNARCINGELCRYHDGPMRCAVGCLILPEFYHPDIEGQGICDRAVEDSVMASTGLLQRDFPSSLLDDMQTIHDTFQPDRWEEQWGNVAQANNLNLPIE